MVQIDKNFRNFCLKTLQSFFLKSSKYVAITKQLAAGQVFRICITCVVSAATPMISEDFAYFSKLSVQSTNKGSLLSSSQNYSLSGGIVKS